MTFAIGTFSREGRQFPGLVIDERRVLDISQDFDSASAVFDRWEENVDALATWAENPGTDPLDLDSVRVLAPLRPGQILQSGANYYQHVFQLTIDQQIGRKSGQSDEEFRAYVQEMMDKRAETAEPYIFPGIDGSLAGPYDDIVLPRRGEQHDWELELAVVIGRHGRDISEKDALDYVAGYTIANDLTTRDLVLRDDLGPIGADFFRSKGASTFLPLGPWIVPARFVEDPMDLRIELKLNGKTMQDESTADMIFGVAELMAYASSFVELRPGDLLLTGSPAGNGTHYNRFLQPGDVMEGTITGLGEQRNTCRAISA